jgi:outer membrane receptor protein involved in Fe transport
MHRLPFTLKFRIVAFALLLILAAAGTLSAQPAAQTPAPQQAAQAAPPATSQTQGAADKPAQAAPRAADLPVFNVNVLVTAPRVDIPLNEMPAATAVVSPAVLSAMPRAIAAEEASRAVPGVKVDNQADGERVHVSIRGQGLLTERGIRGIKVLLDGLPLNDPTGFAPDLFDVDWSAIDRIEVVRGPASALYGGGGRRRDHHHHP